ncbi:MAG: HAD hydrolase-like protein [Myxococcales bacterium]|nr:HAD hydrolase-like protein [Myxococcales bacterium]
MTDPVIVQGAFERAGRAFDASQLPAIFDRYVEVLPEELEARHDAYIVHPGVRELVAAAHEAGHELALATGNIERGARIKLESAGLNPYFPIGGFGSDSAERSELLAAAIRRSSGRWRDDEIIVIGDTERDVQAARRLGVRVVGVLAGSAMRAELRDSGPDLLADSCLAPSLWEWLGLRG